MNTSMKRRNLLQAMAAAPLLGLMPRPLFAANTSPRRLLLIELNGGNDGLNTVIPYADPRYYELRPKLAVARDQVLQLDDRVGLNPALEPLMPFFRDGQLAIVQGLGYTPANRSHFRSIEIWDTASEADETSSEGWLSRLDIGQVFGRRFDADAVVIGRNPRPVSGERMAPVVMADAGSFVAESRGLPVGETSSANAALRHILDVQRETEAAGRALSAGRPKAAGDFPVTPFGRDASEAARLLIGDPLTPIVKIALTGFDTHANQRGRHDGLLQQLGNTLTALRTAFTTAGIWNDTLILSYSEFGRRAQQNGSGGTDHGKAAPQFLLGGRVHGGLHGAAPDLAALDQGDVPATTDFRSLYNSLLGDWWNAPEARIEPQRFKPLSLIA